MKNSLSMYFNRHVSKLDQMIIGFSLILATLGFFLILINTLTTQYYGNNYIFMKWLYMLPVLIVLMIAAMLIREQAPRISFIFIGYMGLYPLLITAGGVFETGLQYTPFPIIDPYLVKFDAFFHFSSGALVDWTHNHPHFQYLLNRAYDSLAVEIAFIPLISTILNDKRSFYQSLFAVIVTLLISSFTYYFFPTIAPAGMFPGHHYEAYEHATSLKFYQLHHHLVPTTDDGGLIAFPSCHVAWSILYAAMVYRRKWLFYPLAAWNVLIIASTMFLGPHYLADVFGGIATAMFSLWIGTKIYNKCIVLQEKAPNGSWVATGAYASSQ